MLPLFLTKSYSQTVDITSFGRPISSRSPSHGIGGAPITVIHDEYFPEQGSTEYSAQYETNDGTMAITDWIGYEFDSSYFFTKVVYEEGVNIPLGGAFDSLWVEVRSADQWIAVQELTISPPFPRNNNINFETFTLQFAPIEGNAMRVIGRTSGREKYASCAELRAFTDRSYPVVMNTAPEVFLKPELQQNYPNPFNPVTSFKFEVSSFELVSLRVYDVLGREVSTLVDERKAPGRYVAHWNADKFPSGLYFCRMTAGSFTATQKLLLIR